jgi:hypothetical protein
MKMDREVELLRELDVLETVSDCCASKFKDADPLTAASAVFARPPGTPGDLTPCARSIAIAPFPAALALPHP